MRLLVLEQMPNRAQFPFDKEIQNVKTLLNYLHCLDVGKSKCLW
jgi:hypothetical protein